MLSKLNPELRKFLDELFGYCPVYHDAYIALEPGTYALEELYKPVSDLKVTFGRPNIPEVMAAEGIVIEVGSGKSQQCDTIKVDRYIYEPGCDVVADAMELPFPDDCADFIYHIALLEHIQEPWRVGAEMFRILKPGATFAVDCAFLQVYHGYPGHYWGITSDGLKYIFRQFEDVQVRSNTTKYDFVTRMCIWCKIPIPPQCGENWKRELMPVAFTGSLTCVGRKPA